MNKKDTPPPKTDQKNSHKTKHGVNLEDKYRWLEDATDQKVQNHIQHENNYSEKYLEKNESLISTIERRLVELTRHDDISCPYRIGSHFYYETLSRGSEHERYYQCRTESRENPSLLFDPNKLEQQYGYVDAAFIEPSLDGKLVAVGTDVKGDESYRISITEIATETVLDKAVAKADGSFAWGKDCKSFYYVKLDGRSRPNSVWHHIIGTKQKDDKKIFHETDQRFFVSCESSRCDQYLIIQTESHRTTEVHLLPITKNASQPICLHPRTEGIECYADVSGEYIYRLSNDGDATDFKVEQFRLKNGHVQTDSKTTFIEHNPGCLIEGIEAFKEVVYIWLRKDGSRLVEAYKHSGEKIGSFTSSSPLASISSGDNYDSNSKTLRLSVSSPTEPETIVEWDPESDEKKVLESYPPPINFDAANYQTVRLFAKAEDEELIPITLMCRSDIDLNANPNLPVYIEAYGAYGDSFETDFSISRIALADQGIATAIAHVRGGEEKGRRWYLSGANQFKKNTITDLIAVRDYLVAEKYASDSGVIIGGASAGGIAIGGALNEAPQKFRAAVLDVPFVDVVTTMAFTDHALSPLEYDEWGDPNEPTAFKNMLSYAPYEQISSKPYPPIYVTASVNDSRVPYWEAVKYVAKMRELSTTDGPYLLKINTDTGHGGVSGRYSMMRDTAEELAFVTSQLNLS